MGLSRFLTGLANFIVLIASGFVLWTGIYLSKRSDGVACFKFLQIALIVVGVALLVVSLLGFIGACCSIPTLLLLYLILIFLCMIALLAFTIFAFLVTNDGVGQDIAGQNYKEYSLGDFSSWLQSQVNDTGKWNTIKSCINESSTCSGLPEKYLNLSSLLGASLAPIQSGCCIPPVDCGYTFVNATYFTIPATGPANTSDSDCYKYSNDVTQLCYDCETCKAGVLKNVQNAWRKVAYADIALLIIIFIVYWVGCCAYGSAERQTYAGYFRGV